MPQTTGYVMFQNVGSADFYALFLVGFTDKADDAESIGMFGSGFKLAVAAAMRQGIEVNVWYYDLRTNTHFTLKTKPLTLDDLTDFIACYKPGERHKRKPTWGEKSPDGRWRRFKYDEIVTRDKTSLDIFWLKDKSLSDLDNLPEPEELAEDIVANLQAALASFEEIANGIEE